MHQMLKAPRYYAAGHFQTTDGDLMGVHHTTVCRIIQRISRCIAKRKAVFMWFPSDLPAVKQSFFEIAAFPAVVGGIDCTHIPVVSFEGDNAKKCIATESDIFP